MKATIPRTGVLSRRLVAALGAAALLTSAGCGNEYVSGTPAALAGTTSEESEAEPGFDECGLLDLRETAEWLGVEALYVTGRSTMTLVDGSPSAGCRYFSADLPGMLGMQLNTVTETDPERFFAPFEKYENVLPLEGIGDRTEAIGYQADGTTVHFLEIRTIVGDRGLHLFYIYGEDGSGMPELDGGEAVRAMMRTAVERLPDEVVIPDGKPEGGCADIDLELAGEVLGTALVSARSVVSDGGAMRCYFGGDGGVNLDITLVTDPATAKDQAVTPDLVTHPDIGDEARVTVLEQRTLQARVNLGARTFVINANYGDGVVGTVTEPRSEDLDLVRAIVDALGEQD